MTFPAWTWFRVPTALYDRFAEVGRAAVVYLVLARHANEAGESWPSQRTIADAAGVSDRSVRGYLTVLERAGLIRGTRRRRDTQVYLLPDLVDAGKTGTTVPVKTEQEWKHSSGLKPQERKHSSGQDGQDRKFSTIKTGSLLPTEVNQEGESKARTRFIAPTVDEVAAYCRERKNTIDPQYFVDYQEARDWKFKGGQAMKSWKATIRTWERNGFANSNGKPKQSEPLQYRDAKR